jgi:hypothetical protein
MHKHDKDLLGELFVVLVLSPLVGWLILMIR